MEIPKEFREKTLRWLVIKELHDWRAVSDEDWAEEMKRFSLGLKNIVGGTNSGRK